MMDDREKDRDRSRRGDRPSRFSDAIRDRSNDRGGHNECKRLHVSNIPYEFRWTELKDLFKEKVGEVAYVELFNDENGKPRGCGVVEFSTPDAMRKALSIMHRYELNGRKLVLKEESGNDRRGGGNSNQQRGGGGGGGGVGGHGGHGGGGVRNNREDKGMMGMDWGANKNREPEDFNTYGLSLQFLDSINIQPPLVKKVFVANLDYKVDRAKIKEIFKMAGKVHNIDLAVDKDGNSRGFAVVEYDHPVEAVQAISLFDKQTLYDRRMTVRMDRGTSERTELRLPEGLKGIGLGLGPTGEPLRDVARKVTTTQTTTNINLANTASSLGTGVLGAVPAAGVSLNGLGSSLAAGTLNANALGGGLGLQALGLTGLGALQNQLLQQGLSATDLASVLAAQAQVQAQAQAVNVNSAAASLGLGNDVGASLLGSGLSNSVMGNNSLGMNSQHNMQNNRGSSRPMSSGNHNQLQGYGNSLSMDSKDKPQMYRDSGMQQNMREKSSDMVVITNLPPTVTWQLIREKFSECGEVKFAEMTAPDTAIVRFQKEWDAERAIKMFDRTRIDGRTIDVRFF